MFQVGTAYFGCRDERGRFSLPRLVALTEQEPIRAIEIKLSQGAKGGLGGLLPAAKVSREIADCRGVPRGRDCVSPPRHAEFDDVDTMLEFVERVADASGLPVGIKSAVGEAEFWNRLARRMAATGTGPDFVTVDGGEGGTGAAPLVFADHVSLPFRLAQARVHAAFQEHDLHRQVVFVGSGRLGFAESALLAMTLGCDMVSVGREAMMAVGCIQAQRCHTGRCPTGVATQSRRLQRGLDPADKGVRLARYVITLRRELLALARACGAAHPALVEPDQLELLDGDRASTVVQRYGLRPGVTRLTAADRVEIEHLMGALGTG